jgi:hypothetical protein
MNKDLLTNNGQSVHWYIGTLAHPLISNYLCLMTEEKSLNFLEEIIEEDFKAGQNR